MGNRRQKGCQKAGKTARVGRSGDKRSSKMQAVGETENDSNALNALESLCCDKDGPEKRVRTKSWTSSCVSSFLRRSASVDDPEFLLQGQSVRFCHLRISSEPCTLFSAFLFPWNDCFTEPACLVYHAVHVMTSSRSARTSRIRKPISTSRRITAQTRSTGFGIWSTCTRCQMFR